MATAKFPSFMQPIMQRHQNCRASQILGNFREFGSKISFQVVFVVHNSRYTVKLYLSTYVSCFFSLRRHIIIFSHVCSNCYYKLFLICNLLLLGSLLTRYTFFAFFLNRSNLVRLIFFSGLVFDLKTHESCSSRDR